MKLLTCLAVATTLSLNVVACDSDSSTEPPNQEYKLTNLNKQISLSVRLSDTISLVADNDNNGFIFDSTKPADSQFVNTQLKTENILSFIRYNRNLC
ncbi:hypothetical protein [Spiroplasma endosymbiont of Nebria brevicollis]|uniref:hypothetical protein n=1 Tax=Spiroplasma endosymbiont of Nebria brevicollis TaxID=3066284 RepID=UPI00313BB5D8